MITMIYHILVSRGKKRVVTDVDCITLEESTNPLDLRGPAAKKSKPAPAPVIECIDID